MYRLVIRERAANNAQQARAWYEEKQTGLGDDFLDELNKCFELLEKWSFSFTKIKKGFRQLF